MANVFTREDGLPFEADLVSIWASADIEDQGPRFQRSELVARSGGYDVRITEVSPRAQGLVFGVSVLSHEGELPDVFGNADDWIERVPSGTAVAYEMVPESVFRFGIEFRDGRAATNLGTVLWRTPGPPFPILLVPIGSYGREDVAEQRWWLSPVPSDDTFTIFVEWPAGGIPLRSHTVRID